MTHRLANNGCQNDTNRFEPIWTDFEPIWTDLNRFQPVLTWLNRVEQNLTTRRAKCHLETSSSLTWSGAERFLVAFYRSFDSIFSKLDRPFFFTWHFDMNFGWLSYFGMKSDCRHQRNLDAYYHLHNMSLHRTLGPMI